MVETLGSPGDLARAFVRVTTGQVRPEAPMLDPPEPEPVAAVRTAPGADPPADPDHRCEVCGEPLTGHQRRFCGDPHRAQWHATRRHTVAVEIREALTDVQRAVGRLHQLCDELAHESAQRDTRKRG